MLNKLNKREKKKIVSEKTMSFAKMKVVWWYEWSTSTRITHKKCVFLLWKKPMMADMNQLHAYWMELITVIAIEFISITATQYLFIVSFLNVLIDINIEITFGRKSISLNISRIILFSYFKEPKNWVHFDNDIQMTSRNNLPINKSVFDIFHFNMIDKWIARQQRVLND